MRRYWIYSSLSHAAGLAFAALFLLLGPKPKPVYYAIDFVGGGGAAGALEALKGGLNVAPPQPSLEDLLPPANVKEDVLTPAKKTKKTLEKHPVVPEAQRLNALKSLLKEVESSAKPSPSSSSEAGAGQSVKAGQGLGAGTGEGAGAGGFSISTDGGIPFPFPWYLRAVVDKIDRQWRLPEGTGVSRACQIGFKVNRGGTVRDAKIEKGSGDEYFDQNALRAVIYASPLPPLPDQFPSSDLIIHFRFSRKR